MPIILTSFVISFIASHGPWLFVLNRKSLSEKELIDIDPNFSGISLKYHLFVSLGIILIGCVLIAVGLLIKDFIGIKVLFFISAFWACNGALIGLFASFTGLYPANSKSINKYIYEKTFVRRLGNFQLFFATLVALGSIFLAFIEIK